MKKYFKKVTALSFFTFSASFLFAQPAFQFEEEVFDFGEVIEGAQVKHTFKFKNVGDEPLQILRVNTTCGCTVPEWSTTAVQPEEEGSIEIVFDSNNRVGKTSRQIYIQSNAVIPEGILGGRYPLEIKGHVSPK